MEVPKQKDPSPSSLVPDPVPADYPLPHLKTIHPSLQQISHSFTVFCSEFEKDNPGLMDITDSSGTQNSLLQLRKGA